MTPQRIKEMIAGALRASRHKTFFEFMRERSCFSEHTLFNRILIWFFHSDATLVAPISSWNKLGRFVKRGEKGIPLIFPLFRDGDDADLPALPACRAAGRPACCGTQRFREAEWYRRQAGRLDFRVFRTEAAYDISQTTGEEVNEASFRPKLSPFPFREAIKSLEDYARSIGFKVIRTPNSDADPPSETDYVNKEIRIYANPSTTESTQFFSLIHEIVHAENHDESSGSVFTKALECEGTVYVIATMLGIPFYESPRLSYLNIPMSAMKYDSIALIERMQQRLGKVISRAIAKSTANQLKGVKA